MSQSMFNPGLIFPYYWGKNFLNTTQYPWITRFSTLAGANKHHTQSSKTFLQSFQVVFFFSVLRFPACMITIQLNIQRRSSVDLHSSLYTLPSSPVLLDPKNFRYLGFPTCLTLPPELGALPGSHISASQPVNVLQGVRQDTCRAHLICFFFPQVSLSFTA